MELISDDPNFFIITGQSTSTGGAIHFDLKMEELTGPTGPTGSTGESITGPTGESITGPTGESITGPTGESITGPTGEGITGPTGEGITGPTGESITGPTGPQAQTDALFTYTTTDVDNPFYNLNTQIPFVVAALVYGSAITMSAPDVILSPGLYQVSYTYSGFPFETNSFVGYLKLNGITINGSLVGASTDPNFVSAISTTLLVNVTQPASVLQMWTATSSVGFTDTTLTRASLNVVRLV